MISTTAFLADRESAAHELASQLAFLRGFRPLVLAIPRGGVPMGRIIADELEGDLDVVLTHKIGAPGEPEFAIGAVDESGDVLLHDSARVASGRELAEAIEREGELLHERRALYTPGRGAPEIEGRTVVIVDDGVATSATLEAAIRFIRKRAPAKLIVAIGVSSRAALRHLRRLVDHVVCVFAPEDFFSVGECYGDFRQVGDGEVVAALHHRSRPPLASRAATG